MCTRYPIINRVSELKVHIELTRFVQPEKIEIDANERAVNEKSQYCFFVCTTFDSFLNDFLNSTNWNLSLCKAGINPYNYFNLEVLTQLSVFCNFSILECQCKSAFSIFIKAKNVKLRKNQFRYSQFYLPQYLEKHCHVLPGAWSGQTPLWVVQSAYVSTHQ